MGKWNIRKLCANKFLYFESGSQYLIILFCCMFPGDFHNKVCRIEYFIAPNLRELPCIKTIEKRKFWHGRLIERSSHQIYLLNQTKSKEKAWKQQIGNGIGHYLAISSFTVFYPEFTWLFGDERKKIICKTSILYQRNSNSKV